MLMFVGLGIFNKKSEGFRDYSFYMAALGSALLFTVAVSAAMNHYQVKKMMKKRGIENAASVEEKLNSMGRHV